MSEMIELVARAICKSRTCEGFMCCQNPAQRGRIECPVKAGGYDDAARAAIEAMREPTNAMVWANEVPHYGPDEARDAWRAMIDVALCSGEQNG